MLFMVKTMNGVLSLNFKLKVAIKLNRKMKVK